MRTFQVVHEYGLGVCITRVDARDEAECRAKCEPFTTVIAIV